jgi:UTP--glucose-1-phosphate uridylyltransferase
MTKLIRKAIFPVAGLGTRFLPATKASPNEMLNVVDKPLIQYAVEEAIASGITELIFVTGRNKRSIEDHFDKSYELEAELNAKNKTALLAIVRQVKPSHVNCVYVRQPEALGLGDAVHCAKNLIGDDAFAVLLADDLLDSDPPVLSQMMAVHQHYQSSVVAVQAIQPEQSTSYGVISGKAFDERLTKMSGVVEKPSPSSAPSNLGVVGRYIFTPAIFKHIQAVQPDADGEFQLTDAIQSLLQEQLVLAYQYEGVRYDCGMKLDYLKASVDIALAHPELQDEFKAYLANRQKLIP